MVSNIHREFVQQAQKATGFSEWANEPNRRERTMEAIHRQVEFGDLRGVKKLAAELKGRGGNYGDEDILSAALGDGVRSYREADGTVMLRITHNNKSESLPWRRRAETSLQQFERWQVFAESRAEREALGAITGRTLTATEAIYVFSRGRITFALNSMRETLERSPRGSPSVTSVTRGPRDPYRAVSWLWWLCRSRRSRHRQGMEA